MTKAYKPSNKNIFTISLLFSFVLYVMLLAIFFVLPKYFNTYRIYDTLNEIPYYFLFVTLLSAGVFLAIWGLTYLIVKNLEAHLENNELIFKLKPVIGERRTYKINLDDLLNVSSLRKPLLVGKAIVFTFPLKFTYKNNENIEVPTFGWDNKTLENILSDINKIRPTLPINTVFFKGGDLNEEG